MQERKGTQDWDKIYPSDDGGNGQPAQGTLNMAQMDGTYSCAGGACEIVAVDGEADVSYFLATIEDGSDMLGTLSPFDPTGSPSSSTSTGDTSAWLNDHVSRDSRDCPKLSRIENDDPDWDKIYPSDDGGNGQPAQGTLNMEQEGSASGLGAGHKRQAPETPTLVGTLPKIDTKAAKEMAIERGWKVLFERSLLPRHLEPDNSQLFTQEEWKDLFLTVTGAQTPKHNHYHHCKTKSARNGMLFDTKPGKDGKRVVHSGEVLEILWGLYMYNDAGAPNKKRLWKAVQTGYANITQEIVFDFFRARNFFYELYGVKEPSGGERFFSTKSITEKLNILTLTGTGLDTDGAVKLAEIWKKIPNLKLLDVSRNNICYKGARALFHQVVTILPTEARPYWSFRPELQSFSGRKGEFVFNCSDNPACDIAEASLSSTVSWNGEYVFNNLDNLFYFDPFCLDVHFVKNGLDLKHGLSWRSRLERRKSILSPHKFCEHGSEELYCLHVTCVLRRKAFSASKKTKMTFERVAAYYGFSESEASAAMEQEINECA